MLFFFAGTALFSAAKISTETFSFEIPEEAAVSPDISIVIENQEFNPVLGAEHYLKKLRDSDETLAVTERKAVFMKYAYENHSIFYGTYSKTVSDNFTAETVYYYDLPSPVSSLLIGFEAAFVTEDAVYDIHIECNENFAGELNEIHPEYFKYDSEIDSLIPVNPELLYKAALENGNGKTLALFKKTVETFTRTLSVTKSSAPKKSELKILFPCGTAPSESYINDVPSDWNPVIINDSTLFEKVLFVKKDGFLSEDDIKEISSFSGNIIKITFTDDGEKKFKKLLKASEDSYLYVISDGKILYKQYCYKIKADDGFIFTEGEIN